MTFLSSLRTRASERPKRIAFPEGDDERVRAAAADLAANGWVRPVVLSGTSSPVAGVEYVDPTDPHRCAEAAGRFASLLRHRDPPISDERIQTRAHAAGVDPLMQAALMLRHGDVDGVVAGCVRSTADVLRAALRCVGLRDGCNTLSSAFYMVVAEDTPEERVLTFTDAGVVPSPSPEQLVDIAASAAAARTRIVGDEPQLAFLSFSTHGSADSPDVRRVRAAVDRFRDLHPGIAADGELQGDAALIPEVRQAKAPGSQLTGSANILVFPSLDAGNISYKLVQRLAGATALGPILQGLSAPMNDLSRGATAADIALVSCITALQSEA